MRIRATTVSVSLLVHAGVAAAFVIGLPVRESPGAIDKGLQGIEVILPAGMPASAPPSPPTEPERPRTVEIQVEPPAEPDVIASKDTAPNIDETPKPAVLPKPRPMIRKPPHEPVATPDTAQVEKPVEASTPDVTLAAVTAPTSRGQTAATADTATANSGDGNPGAQANYYATLSAWLERHKEYPLRARRHHSEGVAFLQFVVGQNGAVLRYRIQRSSGHRILDEAVERMIEKAQPLPPIPAAFGKDHLEIIVPVEFLLK